MEGTPQSQSTPQRRIRSQPVGGVSFALAAVPALAAGLVLRLWMLKVLFIVNGDALVYGGLAKTLLHGHYELNWAGGPPVPTLIRLPGYPIFLAFSFKLFGMENYFAVALLQIVLELLGCLLLAEFAGRIAPPKLKSGARLATLWLAALCPFTASYAVVPLTEAPTLFALALALWAMARFHDRPRWGSALCFTFAVTFAALLRPDGALVAVALAPALLIQMRQQDAPNAMPLKRLVRMTLVCVLLALAPFAAWTWRNWQVFHVFEPLAPRLANDPGEDTNPGWERWVKTWCLDFVSTYDIYWNVPDGPLNLKKVPSRAFDSPAQYAETAALADDYNKSGQNLTPEIDARFAALAQERIAAHPLRYYVWLPLGRLVDMGLRPRVENLDIDLDWWVYSRHRAETRFSLAYAALNLLYLALAAIGLMLRPRFWKAMLAYIALRSAMLLTVEAPEARYTLEWFPMLFVLSGIALYWVMNRVSLSVLKVKASATSA
ncbi:MAG TPA: glycosyltransferase family 39 protein [Terracidiphilus sp.]|nr:glycosyltransferase family 39 protein [Terracidiphilus sp.]